MPKCKNDPTRSFIGTEPSPKGLGYCAHSMKVGAIEKGKDGNKWVIKQVKNGSKRWMMIKEDDIEYDIDNIYKKYLNVIKNGTDGIKEIKKWIKNKTFEKKSKKLEKDYLNIQQKMKGFNKFILEPYGTSSSSYLIYLNKKNKCVYVYKTHKIFIDVQNRPDWIYTILVSKFDYNKIHISSGGSKSYSIKNQAFLLEIKNNNYILIDECNIINLNIQDKIKKFLKFKYESIIIGSENVYIERSIYFKNSLSITGIKRNLFSKKMTDNDWYFIIDEAIEGKYELKKVGKKKKRIKIKESFEQFKVNGKLIDNI